MESTDPSQSSPNFECAFCRRNNMPQTFYRSHNMKDAEGRVVCPVLRTYVCPRCSATGDNAHITLCASTINADRRRIIWPRHMATYRYRVYIVYWPGAPVHVQPPAAPTAAAPAPTAAAPAPTAAAPAPTPTAPAPPAAAPAPPAAAPAPTPAAPAPTPAAPAPAPVAPAPAPTPVAAAANIPHPSAATAPPSTQTEAAQEK